MPTERPSLFGEVEVVPTLADTGVAWSAQRILPVVSLGFLDRSHYYFFQVAPQLSSWGWVDPVPDPLLLSKSESVGNRTQDLWSCSQKLWPLDHRGGQRNTNKKQKCKQHEGFVARSPSLKPILASLWSASNPDHPHVYHFPLFVLFFHSSTSLPPALSLSILYVIKNKTISHFTCICM
jgi:hypothetical protein